MCPNEGDRLNMWPQEPKRPRQTGGTDMFLLLICLLLCAFVGFAHGRCYVFEKHLFVWPMDTGRYPPAHSMTVFSMASWGMFFVFFSRVSVACLRPTLFNSICIPALYRATFRTLYIGSYRVSPPFNAALGAIPNSLLRRRCGMFPNGTPMPAPPGCLTPCTARHFAALECSSSTAAFLSRFQGPLGPMRRLVPSRSFLIVL